ncbi:MAG: glycosyl hydrolase family 79 C-terminal domain-containing protein [Bryobacteraceae bacterium]
MNRREFLAATSAAALAGRGGVQASGDRGLTEGHPVHVVVDARRRLGTIPRDFVGLGYEISSVAIPDLLSARNRTYVELVRTLSPEGVIRVGGNTSDDASYAPTGQAVSAPKGTIVNGANFQELGTFLEATNWRLIWGLNLGSTDERQATAEAEAVSAATDHILAFEIGNEPDLFGRGTVHRPNGYNYEAFLKEFRRYKAAIRAKVAKAPFAGPDVADATDWVVRFAEDERDDLRLLTHHYYRECASPASTLDKLLHVDPKLGPELATLRAASSSAKVPYRICETNSFCGGGMPGVSDSFGAALWVLDFMFLVAYAGCAGVNIETGVNQLGFVSSYSPIRQHESGSYCATPEYYGMLAFGKASQGTALAVDCDSAGANVTAYAVVGDRTGLSVTIINKDESLDAHVSLSIAKELDQAQIFRLIGPSLESKEGVTFGDSVVGSNGKWKPSATEFLHSRGGRAAVHVPAGSAAVIKWVAYNAHTTGLAV